MPWPWGYPTQASLHLGVGPTGTEAATQRPRVRRREAQPVVVEVHEDLAPRAPARDPAPPASQLRVRIVALAPAGPVVQPQVCDLPDRPPLRQLAPGVVADRQRGAVVREQPPDR